MSWAQHAILALAVLAFFLVVFAIPAALGYLALPEKDSFEWVEAALAHPPEPTSDMCPLCDQGIGHGPTLAHAVRPVCAVGHAGTAGSLQAVRRGGGRA
ncbi:MAG: hypothetical protein RL375_851 [Pseudomonadota bacterium]|jgi:hypothetical protein